MIGQEAAVARRHRAIFDSAVDFAILATDVRGRITDWNSGAIRIFGWTVAEMTGNVVDRIFTPEDRERGRPAVEMGEALAAGRAADDRWHMRQDGSRFWASGKMMPLLDDDGRHLGFLKILRDETQQRVAEQERSASEAFLQSVLASSADCIKVLDLDGKLTFMSEGGQRVMEVSDLGAILGCSWPDFWQGRGNVDAKAALDAARGGGTGRFQGGAKTMAGTPKHWDVQVTPILGSDGRPEKLLAVSRDITDSVLAEEWLSLTEARLRLATDAAEIGTWDLDLQTDVLTWSDRTKAMFGISPHLPCSMADFYAGLHPDDREATSEAFSSALDPVRRATYDVEYRTIGKEDGVTRWVAAKGRGLFNADNRCVRAIGTAIDVTAQRSVAERLRESEAALRALNATLEARVEERTQERDQLWALSEDLLVTADYDGHLLRVSPSWTRLLGHDEAALLTRPYAEIVHPDDLGAVMEALLAMRESHRPVSFEDRVLAADATWRWIAWTLSPEPNGERLTGVGRDVTAVKARQLELEAAQEQLRQSQKMEAVGQLTGGLAHDFNNLLAGISGSLELLQSRMAQGRIGDLERYLAAAQGAAKRAAALTHRLLAFSRRQTLAPKPTDANRLIKSMEELIRRTVGPQVTVEVVAAGGLWPTLVDPNQLENALLNLCINARDAMPEGGQLTIETGNKWLDDRAAGERDLIPGQYVSVCVSDTGSGMAPDVVQRAFDPFFTTKPIGLGTGLGLSMVYGFARQSDGQARIYSELGQGAMVCLYLPRYNGEAEGVDETAGLAEAPRAEQGETVLVVDDEPTVRMLVTEVLGDLGYTAIEAADGPAGLRVLQSDARIDLLVTDVGLPGGMNGRQMADAAREHRPGLSVLFITGYAENAVLSHGHLGHGMHVLTKPFAMEALANRIRELINTP